MRLGLESFVACPRTRGSLPPRMKRRPCRPPIPRPRAACRFCHERRSLTGSRDPRRRIEAGSTMKYLTTLEAAHDARRSASRRCSTGCTRGRSPSRRATSRATGCGAQSRVDLVKKLIAQGRLHTRTVVHRQPSNRPEFVAEYAREVSAVPARRRHRHGRLPRARWPAARPLRRRRRGRAARRARPRRG